jgi:hypothetical protein
MRKSPTIMVKCEKVMKTKIKEKETRTKGSKITIY